MSVAPPTLGPMHPKPLVLTTASAAAATRSTFRRPTCGSACSGAAATLARARAVAASVPRRRRVLEAFGEKSEAGAKLLDRLLALSPKKRVTAKDALDDDFFWEGAPPLAAGDRSLPWDCDLVRASRDDTQRSQARARQRKAQQQQAAKS